MGSGRFAARSGNEPRSRPGRHAAGDARPGRYDAGRKGTEQDLITRLRTLPAGPSPDSRFATELRSQLVSITPRIIAESASDGVGLAQPSGRSNRGLLGRARRPLVAVVGAAAVLTLLLTVAVWGAHGALPGQSLYGIKRASENVRLSLADGDAGKAKAYLDQATHRAAESDQLIDTPGGQPSGHLSDLLSRTLNSADSDTRSGIGLIGKLSVAQGSTSPMLGISTWVSQQRGRFTALESRLPAGAARARTDSSLALLQRVEQRLASWQTALTCGCKKVNRSDDLGPVVTS